MNGGQITPSLAASRFKEEYSTSSHFWFDKLIIQSKRWAGLPQAAKSVYAVIACHRNGETGKAFPSERTIAEYSGCDIKTARAGIKGLTIEKLVAARYYTTQRGRTAKEYLLADPPMVKGRAFPFYREVIEAGNWFHLSPSAKALYPVMRCFSFPDPELYFELEGVDLIEDPSSFSSRLYEFCNANIGKLAEYAGIGRRSVYNGLISLEEHGLIRRYTHDEGLFDGWKVGLHPRIVYPPGYLNEKLAERECAKIS